LTLLERIANVFIPNKTEKRGLSLDTIFPNNNSFDSDKALTLTAVWCAIRLLAESVSSLPISVYTKQENGDKTEDTKNPIYKLVKFKPNYYQNKITFFEFIMLSICTTGNSYVQIVRNNSGTPTQLICLDPDKATVVIDNNELFYQIDGAGVLDSSDILHFKTITDDGITGISPIDQCAKALKWSENLEEFGSTFFSNGAKPSSILQTDRALSDTALTRLKSSFANTYGKLKNSNSTIVLEEGLTFKPISISPEQAQFLASREFSISEVARIFRVQPHLLMDLTKSSFNNIEMQSQEFLTYTLMPYITRIEEEMNLKLFRTNELGKTFIEFNVNGLLRGDVKTRNEAYKSGITNGYMSINEVRRYENLNSIEGGDKHFMQLNMTTIEKIGEDADTDS
jgi:HK97 family phage portal protein|tara:strand:+ start:1565 stop:2755 length:1191 start_codon:yes stop_codon:yes gene_type:complete